MSDTPDPVSLRSLSLSGSDASRASDLFLRIDLDRLCVSFDPSVNVRNRYCHRHAVNIFKINLSFEFQTSAD